ncbi:MAG: leucyl aminopeptidase family protein [Chromatiales bacterium]|jgi:leucyl aminopeptidase|nr:leucyl aminopeptidase family protein [Chromatiales bacterium]MDX9768578.1 leucyl aminopeptidase family protein [Ectothiorhodospiraceae bacterium]
MSDCFIDQPTTDAIPIVAVTADDLERWLATQPERTSNWVGTSGYQGKAGSFLCIPNDDGRIACVLAGVDGSEPTWALGDGPSKLPAGVYRLPADWDAGRCEKAAIGWGLGAYRYTRYKAANGELPRLSLAGLERPQRVRDVVEAVALTRDLINTPAEDLMPEQLAHSARALAEAHGAEFFELVGDELLSTNFPCLHAVGRASLHAPRLLDLRWGDPAHPRVTLVGKGVCFDSGGLDLKPSNAMRSMKKDMGGAAHVLGLARLIMGAGLPLRLRVLIGAAENAVSGNAFRPGDVLRSRKGLTIEVENTDAEGRLAICDALTEAVSEQPALLMDFTTLTGAARVAVGTEIAAFFSNDDTLAADLARHAGIDDDPVWRLPLHDGYRHELDSQIADLLNCGTSSYAGAITAALFLKEFVPATTPWLHFDMMAWNLRARPGRPKGAEAMGVRAAFALLEARFGTGAASAGRR